MPAARADDGPSVTLGVDLAAQPATTALCALEWNAGRAVVRDLRVGVDDDDLRRAIANADSVGIDAPFGWPLAFARAVAAWERRESWPAAAPRELRYRTTDLYVQEVTGLWPLSPSSDRIAACAWRAAGLLTALGVRDRLGGERVVEVYPAAALKIWELPYRGYKSGRGPNAAVAALADELRSRTEGWLLLTEEEWGRCRTLHHLLDGVVCALLARAAMCDEVLPPPPGREEQVAAEGWIHLPKPGSLGRLTSSPARSRRRAGTAWLYVFVRVTGRGVTELRRVFRRA